VNRARHFLGFFLVLLCTGLAGAETLPRAPERYFNDYAHLVSPGTAAALDHRLEQFERDTSNQLLVAIYPRMDSASSVEDYTVRIAQSWHVGQAERKNGAVLFVFVAEHQLYIQVGYGLEGVLPDATCFSIIEHEIKPRFQANDYNSGLTAGVNAMIAATRNEYRGTGKTQAEALGHKTRSNGGISSLVIFVIFLLITGANVFRSRRRTVYQTPNRGWRRGDDWFGPGGGWGGGFGSGGSSGGGGFSGGGGSFGGGGAGGKW
jgi:uncharacterized protein